MWLNTKAHNYRKQTQLDPKRGINTNIIIIEVFMHTFFYEQIFQTENQKQ
jgi:hypothetical protein